MQLVKNKNEVKYFVTFVKNESAKSYSFHRLIMEKVEIEVSAVLLEIFDFFTYMFIE